MAKTYGYLRVSTDTQDTNNQMQEIVRNLVVDEFISVECSSRKSQDKRGLTELFDRLQYGDTLVVTELSRLARSTSELLLMIEGFIKRGIGLVALKQSIRIPANGDKMDAATKTIVIMFGLMAELERDFISDRTKMGLAARRAAGVRLGKPPGTQQASRLDGKRDQIRDRLTTGHSVLSISKLLGVGRTTLVSYIRSRGLAAPASVCGNSSPDKIIP